MCPIYMETGVRCCCCSAVEIGTLDMSDAQEIALGVIRKGAKTLIDSITSGGCVLFVE